QGSRALYERARNSLSGGVASAYQERTPWPIYLSHGRGSRVWDVDGTERVDFHNGFGSMVQGHAHPAIVHAVRERVELGTHFAAPTEDAVFVAEELKRRFGLPRWRFVNSGSEATMDAIRIARAKTGRETIVKIFGSYHGHHDYVMVSIGVPYDEIGDRESYASLPYGSGIPQSVADLTIAGPFNGNPLARAAARASLSEVLTPEAYELLERLEARFLKGCQDVIERYGLPGYAVGLGAKGCVTFSPEPVVDYDSFKANQDGELADLAWLYNMNRRVYMTPGREEEWTLTVAHSEEDCDTFVAAFDELAADLTA